MTVLDTSYLIDLERGNDAALTALDTMVNNRDPMRVPAQAATEYVTGFEDPVANLHDLQASYQLVPYHREHILETARIARKALLQGTFPGWPGCHIASAAILYGEPIATANRAHYDALGCKVWAYREDIEPPSP